MIDPETGYNDDYDNEPEFDEMIEECDLCGSDQDVVNLSNGGHICAICQAALGER